MTAPTDARRRPAWTPDGDASRGAGDTSSLRAAAHSHTDVPEGHALLLRVNGRRRLVLSVAAADRALERAKGRGDHASVELVALVPVIQIGR